MATVAEVQAAYRAIARTELPAATAQTVVNAGTSIDSYIASLLTQTASTTQAAVTVAAFLQGTVPTADRLDSLTAFAQVQTASYAALGQNATIGAFEAIGRGLAGDPTTTAAFAAKYGALSTSDFVTQAYTEVFGVTPSVGAAANLQSQVAYFTNLYTGAGIPAAQAALLAKGATIGQVLGYAITDPSFTAIGSLDDKVKAVLTAAAKGDATVYNKALPNTPNAGSAGVTVQLTAGADTVSPSSANPALKTTGGDDTISGTTAGFLANGDNIDGGGGTDTLIGKLAGNVSTNPALAAANKLALTSVESLRIDGSGFAFDATGMTGVNSVTATGSTFFNNLSSSLKLAAEGAGSVRFAFGTTAPAASAEVALKNFTGGFLNIGDLAAGGQSGATAVTLNVEANSTTTLFLDDAVTLALKGSGNTNFTIGFGVNTKLNSITAAEATGAIALTHNLQALDTTVTLSAQSDIFRSDFATQKLVTLTTGTGNDLVAATGLANADFNPDNTLKAGLVVTDFNRGTDKIDLTALGANAVVLSAGTLAAINAATNVKAAVNAALNDAAMVANKFTSFVFNSETYIVREDAVNGVSIGDGLIKLAGVTLATIGAGAANDILTA